MLKGNLKNQSPIVKLFILLGLLLLSFLIVLVISMFIALPIFKINIFSLMGILGKLNINDHFQVNIFKYFQIWQTIGLFIIPPILAGFLFSDSAGDYLRLNKKTRIISLLIAFFIVLSSLPIIDWMVDLNSRLILPPQLKSLEIWMKHMEDEAGVLTKAFLNVTTIKGFAFNIFVIALIPAIGEELLFRGFLVTFLKDWTKNIHVAVWISAIVFSAIHFQFYGFVPRMMLGALLGYLFVWSGSIWVPILAHFTNNGIAVLGSYLQNKGIIKNDIENVFSDHTNYVYLGISIISFIVFMILFYNWEKKSNETAGVMSNEQ